MTSRIERLVEAQAETGRTVNRLMLTLLGLGLVGTLTLGFPDSYLLTTATTVNVPFVGGASFKVMILLGPVLLIAVRAYLEIYVAHWRRIDSLVQRSPQARSKRLPLVSPLRHPMLRLFSAFVLYFLVPLVLGVMTYKAMVFRLWGVGLLCLTLISTIVPICLRIYRPWPSNMVVPSVFLLAIVASAEFIGAFDGFNRPFRLQLANLEREILIDQDLRGADLRSANLREADLYRAKLDGAHLGRAHLEGVRLSEASLTDTILVDARLEGAYLNRASLPRARLERAKLVGANLHFAYLEDARLDQAQLQGALLSRTWLVGVNFRGVQLKGAKFYRTVLNNADLRDAVGLTQAQLDGACGNAKTRIPNGLTIPACPADLSHGLNW